MDSPALKWKARIRAVLTVAVLLLSAGNSFAVEESFGGVGLQVVPVVTGELVVLQVIEGAPADEEGLRPGDFIFRVDEQPLAGTDFTEVVTRLLWGPAGTSVVLHYRRPGVAGAREVILTRTEIEAVSDPTPGVRMLNPDEQPSKR